VNTIGLFQNLDLSEHITPHLFEVRRRNAWRPIFRNCVQLMPAFRRWGAGQTASEQILVANSWEGMPTSLSDLL
jgi:hypothetical protein